MEVFIVFEYDYVLGCMAIGVCSTLDDAKAVIGAERIEVWSGMDRIEAYDLLNNGWCANRF